MKIMIGIFSGVIVFLALVLTYLAWRNGKWMKQSSKETQELIREMHKETRELIKETHKESLKVMRYIATLIGNTKKK